LSENVICPRCNEYGKLENHHKDYYRINHDKMSKGLRKVKRCYLGSLKKALRNLTSVSMIRDDILDPVLVSELKDAISEERKEHTKKIKDSEYGTLISAIIQASKKYGHWKSDTHKLTKQDNCPHCKKTIQYEFERIGPYQRLKKNITSFSIGKGSVYKTSRMKEL